MFRTTLLTTVAAVVLISAPAALARTVAQNPPQAAVPATPAVAGNVIDVLRADGRFTVLLDAFDAAHLTATLKSQRAVTIFAPTDAAFAKLPQAERAELLDPANVAELRQLLLYHVMVAAVESSQITGTRGGVETAAGVPAQLDGTSGGIKIDDATVTTADVHASNGAVFVIDAVLTPSAVVDPDTDADPAAAIPERTPPLEQDPDDEDTAPMTSPVLPPAPVPDLPA